MFKARHPAMHKRVLVSLFSGSAVAGVMADQIGNTFVLKGCTVHEPGAAQPVVADGELCIDLSNVDFMQITGE